jgi:hypothetical protein
MQLIVCFFVFSSFWAWSGNVILCELFQAKEASFYDAVRYVLPRLLSEPIRHCLHYIDLIKVSCSFRCCFSCNLVERENNTLYSNVG